MLIQRERYDSDFMPRLKETGLHGRVSALGGVKSSLFRLLRIAVARSEKGAGSAVIEGNENLRLG